MELLILSMFCGQICYLKWILLFLELLINLLFSLVNFVFLPYLFIHIMFLDDFLVHLWLKTIPSIFFALPIKIKVLNNVISCYFLTCEFSSYFSRSLCTISFWMSHRTTVLASSLTKRCCLMTLLSTGIPLGNLRFGLKRRCINWLSFALSILGIPRNLLYVFGGVLHFIIFQLIKASLLNITKV